MNKDLLGLLPSSILNVLLMLKKKGYRWYGNYQSFEEAKAKSTGYESADIIQKTLSNNKKEIQQNDVSNVTNMQLICSVFICINHIQNKSINILDFGGATGFHYKLIKNYLSSAIKLKYTICETKELVKKATAIFSTNELSFIDDISDYHDSKPDIVMISGTLQYLDEPASVLETLIKLDPKFIIVNRFPVIYSSNDRLTIQHVPKSVYNGSYPCWFFSLPKWESILKNYKQYYLMIKWDTKSEYVFLDGKKVYYVGYMLKRIQ